MTGLGVVVVYGYIAGILTYLHRTSGRDDPKAAAVAHEFIRTQLKEPRR